MTVKIDENNTVIKRECRCCSYVEDIEFYYLNFERGLDKKYLNCHMQERCPQCKNYYDIVLDADDSWGGEEIVVHIINYRVQEDLLAFIKSK